MYVAVEPVIREPNVCSLAAGLKWDEMNRAKVSTIHSLSKQLVAFKSLIAQLVDDQTGVLTTRAAKSSQPEMPFFSLRAAKSDQTEQDEFRDSALP